MILEAMVLGVGVAVSIIFYCSRKPDVQAKIKRESNPRRVAKKRRCSLKQFLQVYISLVDVMNLAIKLGEIIGKYLN